MEIIRLSPDTERKLADILEPFGKDYKKFCNDRGSKRKKTAPASYRYVEAIGIDICPYCNMNYIVTVYSGGRARATLDHFLCRKLHPDNAMDPRNLIPSCSTCNSSLKGQKPTSFDTHLHPFHDDFNSMVRIGVDVKGVDIYTDPKTLHAVFDILAHDAGERIRNTISLFCLKERYALVGGTIREMILLARTWQELRTKEDLELVYGKRTPDNHLDALLHHILHCSINHTSLGKLKKDVLFQLLRRG